MRDDGHFTFEAVVGIAVAATIMLSIQAIESGLIGRSGRARATFKEAIVLDHLISCVPKARTASSLPETTTVNKVTCPPLAPIGTVSENSRLRIHAVRFREESPQDVLHVLTLEFVE